MINKKNQSNTIGYNRPIVSTGQSRSHKSEPQKYAKGNEPSRAKAPATNEVASIEAQDEKEKFLLKESARLLWIADSVRNTLKKSKTNRWLKLKFHKQIEILKENGQELDVSLFFLKYFCIPYPED